MDIDQLRMIGRVFYYGVCVAAVLRGDRPLRYAGAAIIANALLSPLAQIGHIRGEPYYGVLLLDFALLVGLSAVLLRDRRWWLVVVTGCLLMGTLTQIAAQIGTHINNYTTSTVRLLWAYAQIVAIAWGLVLHERGRVAVDRADAVRTLIAEQGEARARAELDRRYLSARTPAERAEATRLVETLRRLIEAR